jgi:sulfhydrogenase subunit alpha
MKTIEVPALARVEGEGGLHIGIQDDQVVDIRLDIYEPPRFFEGFLVGRDYQEVADITARICGICPVAYQMSSIIAMEKALDVIITPQVYHLRRLMYCGEFIQSHALHIYLLQAPDLLGQPSALELAAIAPEVVKKALRMKKTGNELIKAIGGRSVHPVNACVGGFHRWPAGESLHALLPDLEWGLNAAKETVQWSQTLPYPELEIDYEFVALHHSEEYAIMRGDAWSSKGYKTLVEDYEMRYFEKHVQYSNALHGQTSLGGSYLVGPLARLNLNHEQLHPDAQEAIKKAKFDLPLRNPYKSLMARAIELVHFFAEAIQLIKAYQPDGPAHQNPTLKAGAGAGASEAPRGLLYHRYKIDDQGLITFAKIVPPTAQNLPRIEADLFALSPLLLKMGQEEATLAAEHLIRSYDPCISCATHFLKLKIEKKD